MLQCGGKQDHLKQSIAWADGMTEAPTESAVVATLLEQWSKGDRAAFDRLLPHLYRDIHAIAVRQLRHERYVTIRPTALVNEAYLRLASLTHLNWRDRAHFLCVAARVTRQAVVDEVRHRRAQKRDGGVPVTLSDENLGLGNAHYDALDVDALLTELEGIDPTAAEVVILRVFGGLSIAEVAEALQISTATANRRWVLGKTWLTRELTRDS